MRKLLFTYRAYKFFVFLYVLDIFLIPLPMYNFYMLVEVERSGKRFQTLFAVM